MVCTKQSAKKGTGGVALCNELAFMAAQKALVTSSGVKEPHRFKAGEFLS